MSTTGCRVGTQVDLAAELTQRRGCRRRPLRRHALSLEDERAHRLVHRGEVAVEELLGLVRLRRDPGSLAQLQHRLVRRRQLPPRARHDEPLLLPDLRATAPRAPPRPRPGATPTSSPCSAAIAATAHV